MGDTYSDDGELLLSESTLERVWLSRDWDVRIEHTELGATYFARREQMRAEAEAQLEPSTRRWPYVLVAAAGVLAGAAGAIVGAGLI